MGDMEKYLLPTKFFDFNNLRVKNKASEITRGLNTEKEKAIAIFYWVRDQIKYNMKLFIPMIKQNFIASQTIR